MPRFAYIGGDALQAAQVAWGREHESGGRLRRLEAENARLRRTVADLALDKQIPQESQERNLQALSGSVVVCYRNHVRSYDFVVDRLANGKLIRMLAVIDESVREFLAIRVGFRLGSEDVLDVLSGLFVSEGLPGHIRSGNGSEFAAHPLRDWLCVLGVKTS